MCSWLSKQTGDPHVTARFRSARTTGADLDKLNREALVAEPFALSPDDADKIAASIVSVQKLENATKTFDIESLLASPVTRRPPSVHVPASPEVPRASTTTPTPTPTPAAAPFVPTAAKSASPTPSPAHSPVPGTAAPHVPHQPYTPHTGVHGARAGSGAGNSAMSATGLMSMLGMGGSSSAHSSPSLGRRATSTSPTASPAPAPAPAAPAPAPVPAAPFVPQSQASPSEKPISSTPSPAPVVSKPTPVQSFPTPAPTASTAAPVRAPLFQPTAPKSNYFMALMAEDERRKRRAQELIQEENARRKERERQQQLEAENERLRQRLEMLEQQQRIAEQKSQVERMIQAQQAANARQQLYGESPSCSPFGMQNSPKPARSQSMWSQAPQSATVYCQPQPQQPVQPQPQPQPQPQEEDKEEIMLNDAELELQKVADLVGDINAAVSHAESHTEEPPKATVAMDNEADRIFADIVGDTTPQAISTDSEADILLRDITSQLNRNKVEVPVERFEVTTPVGAPEDLMIPEQTPAPEEPEKQPVEEEQHQEHQQEEEEHGKLQQQQQWHASKVIGKGPRGASSVSLGARGNSQAWPKPVEEDEAPFLPTMYQNPESASQATTKMTVTGARPRSNSASQGFDRSESDSVQMKAFMSPGVPRRANAGTLAGVRSVASAAAMIGSGKKGSDPVKMEPLDMRGEAKSLLAVMQSMDGAAWDDTTIDYWSSRPFPAEHWNESAADCPKSLVSPACKAAGFHIEACYDAETHTMGTDQLGLSVRQAEEESHFYQEFFKDKPQETYINADVPLVLSIQTITERRQATKCCRVIVRTKKEDQRVLVPFNKKMRALKAQVPMLKDLKLTPVKNPKFQDELLRYEEKQMPQRNYKFGVLYCKKNQTDENEMYGNLDQESSKPYQDFLKFLGERVKLQGFDKYRAGLDVKSNNTGEYSVYTTYQDGWYQIMFHVATLLPFQPADEQKVERKRHIGNDVVTIVFKEQENEDDRFDPTILTSHFIHCSFVISPILNADGETTHYRLTVANKSGVPPYTPYIPMTENPEETGVFAADENFRRFLLVKMINAERTAMASPEFQSLTTARKLYLQSLCTTAMESGK